jgi:hypothetical protein
MPASLGPLTPTPLIVTPVEPRHKILVYVAVSPDSRVSRRYESAPPIAALHRLEGSVAVAWLGASRCWL